MKTVVLFVLLCTGCSAVADFKVPVDFKPMVGKGTVVSGASNDGFNSDAAYKISVSEYVGVDEGSHIDIPFSNDLTPLGYYYSIGNLNDALAGSVGFTYRLKDRIGLFAGFSKWESESWGLEYGAHFLMKDFLIEIRNDGSIDDLFVGLGKSVQFSLK
ncbi:MAG: hypothetical protein HOF41_02415 [Candidatus Marinimicrobia bacterium]|jgi:hypothetical protein|nr:hypothetical protein [Candidatus Neomarinimicrobiota bacterium]